MALTSPGVEIDIIDQSQYLPAPTNSVPLVVLATAQNKADPTTPGAVAQATTLANAGQLYQVTSQRDLVSLYGNPFFYTTTNGTPIQGYELNEYGLLAAYSLLGVTNRCYVLRADIDLASLVGLTARPSAAPADGTFWMDTTQTTWGIYAFNASTGQFTAQTPLVITDPLDISGGIPLPSIGNIGQYAVYATQPATIDPVGQSQYYYKTTANEWVPLGSTGWLADIPTVQATNSVTTFTGSGTLTLTIDGYTIPTITITANETLTSVVSAINGLGYSFLKAANRSGKLCIFSTQTSDTGNTSYYLGVSGDSGTLTQLGITAGNFYQPALAYGTSAQMPLWTAGQSIQRPTGSVWIKVGAAGNGLNPVISEYNNISASWKSQVVTLAQSDSEVDSTLDATGGALIPAGTVYAQYNYNGDYNQAPVFLWERAVLGQTVVTGTTAPTAIPAGYLTVTVSVPGQSTMSEQYFVILNSVSTATQFVTAWAAANVPYTTAAVTDTGNIQLTHTLGGEIQIIDYDFVNGSNAPYGILSAIGMVAGTTPFVKYGDGFTVSFTTLTGTASPSGGTGATFKINTQYGAYFVNQSGVTSGGTGYSVGDHITIAGTEMGGASPANDLVLEVVAETGGVISSVTYVSGTPVTHLSAQLSNWTQLDYTASIDAPVAMPANNTNWFYSVVDQVDIMVNYNGAWYGYGNKKYNFNGFPISGTNNTDPNGPIVSASMPTTQSTGNALEFGDIWIDTSDLENYPIINRWQSVSNVPQWVTIDNTDSTNSSGVVFMDARWGNSGAIDPVNDPIPTIQSLLTSNYVDLDAPSPSLYPTGTLLFNTRRSGYNVKRFATNYFTNANYPNAGAFNPEAPTNDQNLPEVSYTWVSESGLMANGAPYMGRKAQRNMVVKSLRSVIDTNTDIRDEDNFFNLIATPNYPELQPNMVVLNDDRGQTGYILGDTPMRLADDATAIQDWATNTAGADATGEDGLVTRDTYLGLFYPSGMTSDLSGNLVAVPASHMMLRTFLRNDSVAYPWFAAAGTRRGTIDNATSIGYIDSTTGNFVSIKTSQGIRDVLYINSINPLVFFTAVGLLNYGNKTSFESNSALDRTNVARLVAYIRRQLTLASRPFVFEPNDALTRQQIQGVIQSLMVDLVAKRGLYDYLVVCDESNNTPTRIDQNQLWVDVAIEPVKAAEFIYIPVRVLNTGGIAALGANA